MKKILSIASIIILAFTMIVIPAFAAGNGSISISSASGKQGDTLTLNVNMNSNPGLVTMTIRVTYDTAVLQLTGVADSKLLVGAQLNTTYNSPYTIAWVDGSATTNNTKTGKIASFTFKIKDNAKVGTSNVTLQFVDSFDTNYNENSFTATSGKITVNCQSHTYGAYTNKDASNHTRTCSACGNVETKAHTWNSGTVTKSANCKETGTKTFTCTACNATKTETIAKTNNHTYGAWTQTKAPTCTAKGSESRTCSTCQHVETRDIAATGHSMSGWKTTKEAGCETKGEQTRSCSKCGQKETKAIAATGHKFSNPTVTKQPTCTDAGIETGKCSACGKTTTNTIKALGHNFGKWTDTKAPTCTEKGMQERKCSRCDMAEQRETNPLGHDFEKPVIVKQPTLTEKGIEEGVCKRCGEKTQSEIPCVFKDETTGIVFTPEEGTFEQGTEIKIDVIEKDNALFETVKTALGDIADEFVVYDVSAVLNNANVQPGKPVTVTFNIPDGYGKNVAVFYISDDGVAEKLETAVSGDGKTVSATLTHFSSYAVVKIADEKSTEKADAIANTTGTSNNLLWIIVAIVVIAVIGVIIAIIVAKKKKATIV